MRYLEAKKLREQRADGAEENKMQTGSRTDQTQPISVDVLAKQQGVNLADVKGTGPNGEVTHKDVRTHARETRARNQEHPPVISPKAK